MPTAASPCRGICTLDAPSRLCLGCGRTLDEIAAWGTLGEEQRLGIMALLPARLAAACETALDGAPADP